MNTQLTKPGNVSTAGILLIIGGVVTLFTTIATASFMVPLSFCLWTPITIYGFVAGILSIVKGAQLTGNVQPGAGVPIAGPVLLMVNLINFDVIGAVLGLIALLVASDSETKAWLEGRGVPTLMAPGTMPGAMNVTPGAAAGMQAQPNWGQAPAPQWGPPPPAQPAPPPPAPDAGWGTSTPESEAAADAAATGNNWADWGAPAAEPAWPQDSAPAAPAPPAPQWPQDHTPVEVAPAADEKWGDWSASSQQTPPEADPLRPEAWDLGDDSGKKS